MCGICGKLNYKEPEKNVSPALLESMTNIMEHRGPDDSGFYYSGGVGLGHRRLSIIDLSPLGHQPMFNEDKTVAIVFNGEIYNYLDLKAELEKAGHIFRSNCDTEVIIHAYEQWGAHCPTRFNGMFAFAIWDERKKRLVLVRDRVGIKPLYYYDNGKSIAFASEIKSLLQDAEVPREVDPQALSNFLTLHYVPGPRTMFKGIKKLQPGHVLILENGAKSVAPFWELSKDREKANALAAVNEKELADIVYSALEESVRKRLQSDVPVGALLSGGLDSSAILGMMTRITGKSVPAFTVGYSLDGVDKVSEFKYSRSVARHFKSDYSEAVVTPEIFRDFLPRAIWHQDEPIGEAPSIPLYFVCRLARDSGVTVLLTGEGSDELFAGYNRHWGEVLSDYYQRVPGFLRDTLLKRLIHMVPGAPLLKKGHRSMSIPDFNERYMSWHTVFTEDLKGELFKCAPVADTFKDVFSRFSGKIKGLTNLEKILLMDINVWLPDDLLMKKDKMGMATSIEARVPFLDYTFVELAFQIPSRYKVKKLETKYILKKSMERLLPREIIYRKKEGFPTPISGWIKNELFDFFHDLLCSRDALDHGFFEPQKVKKILYDHIQGREDNARLLFPIINFEIWHKLFIKGVKEEQVLPARF